MAEEKIRDMDVHDAIAVLHRKVYEACKILFDLETIGKMKGSAHDHASEAANAAVGVLCRNWKT